MQIQLTKVFCVISFIVLLTPFIIFSQDTEYSIQVTNSKTHKIISNVTVTVSGTSTTAMIDSDGQYRILASIGDELVFSSERFIDKKII